jgi:hypothetical protein
MRPSRMTMPLTILTPGPSTVDPVTGNPRPGAPISVSVLGYLAQNPVANLSSQVELRGTQTTVISLFTVLVPAGTVLTAESTVVDASGRRFEVAGEPADRVGLSRQVMFRAAALRLISDLQGA